jgi:hypothetical protein
MATKNQIVEQDRQSELRRTDAAATIISHARHAGDLDVPDAGRGVAVGVLSGLIEAIDGELADVLELRRKGWQGRRDAHATAVEVVCTWRDRLVAYTPPAGRPEPAEIAVDHRADTPAELETRLTEAFGPELAPVRHVRTVIEHNPAPDDGSTTYGALCGGKTGSWTHRGGANCETCIATYDDEHGPYTGPTAWQDGPVTPEVARAMREAGPFTVPAGPAIDTVPVVPPSTTNDGQGEIRNSDQGYVDPPDHKVGDKVAVGGTEFTKHSEWPALNIIEPSGPQARPRMTPEQVRAHGLARQRGAKHRSVSQVTGYADCGTRYALDNLEAPAWWNVGGKALHRCVEEINRLAANDNTAVEVLGDTESMWIRAFDAEINDQHIAQPQVPTEQWRVANRGKENYDWWRVEGPIMVQRYVAWLLARLADGWEFARTTRGPVGNEHITNHPVIEFECHLDVGASVPNLSIVDMALIHPMHQILEVIDVKAGASAPKDTFQLGVYGWALLAAGVAGFIPAPDYSNVRGRYWRARTGTCAPEEEKAGWPVLAMHPWPSVVDRYRTQDTMERQGFYQPNVSSFCGGCGVRDLCPAQANV